ncbi:MAG: hypothetical protein IKB70_08630 [Bacilli bacterium]|nr:hypothetical protein [Bacilli bacterium]
MFQLSKTENAPIKTVSVIKYALSSLLNAKNNANSLYKCWLDNESKEPNYVFEGSENIKKYVNYCTNCLREYFKAIKSRFLSFWNGESELLKVFSKINIDFSKDNFAFPYAGAQYSMFVKNIFAPPILATYVESVNDE